jgi:hypothetical protein
MGPSISDTSLWPGPWHDHDRRGVPVVMSSNMKPMPVVACCRIMNEQRKAIAQKDAEIARLKALLAENNQ